MKRILLMGGKNDLGDYSLKVARFQSLMFHGETIGSILYKNVFNIKSIFLPMWSIVVTEEVKQELDGIKDFEFKILEGTRYFEFDYFNDCSKEERKYAKTEKSNYRNYYEKLKSWPNENLKLFLLRLPLINDLSGKFKPVRVEIPDLEAAFLLHPHELEKIPFYNGFKYNGYKFFKHEVFEKIERFIDKDFFVIREVDIPIESVSIN